MIDTTGERWKGDGLAEIADHLREYEAEGYPVDHVAESVCAAVGRRGG